LNTSSKIGLKPMMDVMHFGTPLWLKQAVGDPEFPEALERFAEAHGHPLSRQRSTAGARSTSRW
jgi:hypothetical protein